MWIKVYLVRTTLAALNTGALDYEDAVTVYLDLKGLKILVPTLEG